MKSRVSFVILTLGGILGGGIAYGERASLLRGLALVLFFAAFLLGITWEDRLDKKQ